MSKLFPFAILALGSLVTSQLFAEETSRETVEVYASRTNDTLKETPATVRVIPRSEIARYEAVGQNLGTVLGKILPALGAPTQSVSHFGQTVRGRDVLIVIDGIPQIENRQVSRQLNSIKLDTIERVEFVSGANAIYGAGAPGGILFVTTKAYRDEPIGWETSLGTSFQTNPISNLSQDYSLQQTASGTTGAFQYLLSIGAEWRNNRLDSNGDVIPPEPAQTSRNDTQNLSGLAKARYQHSATSSSEIIIETFDEQQDTDYVVQLDPYRAETGLELDEQPSSKRRQFLYRFDDQAFFGQKLSVLAFHRNRELSFFPFALTVPVPLVNQSRTYAESSGLKAVVQSDPLPNLQMAWGLDLELEKGRQRAHSYDQLRYEISGGKVYSGKSANYDYGPAIDTKKVALFTQMKATITDQLMSKFGLRWEQVGQKVHDFTPPVETAISKNWPILYAGVAQMESLGRVPPGTAASLPRSFVPENFEGGERSYDTWAGNLGFTYDLDARNLLFVNYSQGYELGDMARLMRDAVSPNSIIPTISPIFGLNILSTTVSELELQAIKTSSYELGWRGSWADLFGATTLFYNESDKMYQFNADFSVDLLDLKKRVYGLDLELGWRASDTLTLGMSHARAKGEAKRVEGGGWAKISGMEVSPPKTTAYVDYRPASHMAFMLFAQHLAPYSKEDDLNPNDRKAALDLAEYFTVDGNASYAFNDDASLSFGVSNLLNRRYKTLFHQWAEHTYGEASGAPAEGRRFSLAYRQRY